MNLQEFRHKLHPLRVGYNRLRMEPLHKKNITSVGKRKYYIIRFDDEMRCGWTVWERVVLYGCIYAEDHHMIPVVDMQYCHNIYQEEEEYDKVNAWEKYYLQPGGVDLEAALSSKSYVLADPSQEWFNYIRMRRRKLENNEYLREKYKQYIRYNNETTDRLAHNFNTLLEENDVMDGSRLLGLCVRGTDYKKYHHMVQPEIKSMLNEVGGVIHQFDYQGIFVATEDNEILQEIKKNFPEYKLLTYKAGEIKNTEGYIGDTIRKSKTAGEASMDYLTVLYGLDQCDSLIGGMCGATIVAKYKKPYRYIHIYDFQKSY